MRRYLAIRPSIGHGDHTLLFSVYCEPSGCNTPGKMEREFGELSVDCPRENAGELMIKYFDGFSWMGGGWATGEGLVDHMLEHTYLKIRRSASSDKRKAGWPQAWRGVRVANSRTRRVKRVLGLGGP